MKLKLFLIPFAILSLVACNQSGKKESQQTVDSLAQKLGQPKDTSNMEGNHPGVYFLNLKDGDKVKSPVIIEMGVKGMQVEAAGKINDGKGHHHIIIDGTFVEKGNMVPKDETHLHFGKGQTSDTLKLSPGKHTLTLQFANGAHESYGKDWSSTITLNVE
jgi:hypothetical protein